MTTWARLIEKCALLRIGLFAIITHASFNCIAFNFKKYDKHPFKISRAILHKIHVWMVLSISSIVVEYYNYEEED